MPPDATVLLPEGLLDGWVLTEDTTETLFSLPTARVEGHTLVYEDAALREAVRDSHGVDHPWRFWFVTHVAFTPPLAPGGAAMVKPSVVTEARRAFAADLRERGLREVERGHTETMRVQSGARARLSDFRAAYDLGGESVPVRGWLAVWADGDFRLAGGAYPEASLGGLFEPNSYRNELLDLIRAAG
jgi:hypothetical protein